MRNIKNVNYSLAEKFCRMSETSRIGQSIIGRYKRKKRCEMKNKY